MLTLVGRTLAILVPNARVYSTYSIGSAPSALINTTRLAWRSYSYALPILADFKPATARPDIAIGVAATLPAGDALPVARALAAGEAARALRDALIAATLGELARAARAEADAFPAAGFLVVAAGAYAVDAIAVLAAVGDAVARLAESEPFALLRRRADWQHRGERGQQGAPWDAAGKGAREGIEAGIVHRRDSGRRGQPFARSCVRNDEMSRARLQHGIATANSHPEPVEGSRSLLTSVPRRDPPIGSG